MPTDKIDESTPVTPEPAKLSARALARSELLRSAPLAVGGSWAKAWFSSLGADGRSVTGGWPGTMAEARARVQAHLSFELSKRALPPASADELRTATQAMYDRARRDWLAVAAGTRPRARAKSSRSESHS
jgi:hypothetical protein